MQSKTSTRYTWNYSNLFWIPFVHIIALTAIPFFSWSGLLLCAFGLFVLAPLGINIGYHRLLTHRSFQTSNWLKYTLVTFGAIAAAGPPIYWAAMHRIHHRFSDTERDPHNSLKGFWHSHVLHLFFVSKEELDDQVLQKYTPDLLRESYLVFLNKYWILFALATLPLLYLIGGISFVLWGVFVRVVLSWHIMWLVNSASHMWGYRNYNTKDKTVNCWWVSLLAAGEGWHNNHHAYPSCASHGHKWWEFDFSYLIIRVLKALHLVRNVQTPPKTSENLILTDTAIPRY